MPSDGYNTRRMKIANKRTIMLERKLHETVVNKTNVLTSSSGLTSPTPSSSVLTDDRHSDLTDDNASKQHYNFGTAYGSRKSSLNTEPARKFSLSVDDHNTHKSEDMVKSQSKELLEKENEDSDTYTKTRRSGSFQENGRKDVFANLMADTRKETGAGKDSLLSVELKSAENGLKEIIGSDNKSKKGSMAVGKLNCAEEKLVPTITNRSPSRRGSLERENRSFEESMPAVNKTSSEKGPLKTEKTDFLEGESIPAVRNKSSSRDCLNNNINLDIDSVKHAASYITERAYIPSNKNGTKNDTPCEYGFAEASENLSETSQVWNKTQNTILNERQVTDTKLKQLVYNSETEALETKGYEKKKLLAALKAIDDGEDPSVVNAGETRSSVLEGLLTNSTSDPGSSFNISLPFIGQMRVLDKQWEGKVTSEERRIDVEQPKTKTELMQELFGGHIRDLTTGNNNSV
jgi:hypothetical protein